MIRESAAAVAVTYAAGKCLLQIQPRRPPLDPAQQQMLDRVERNRAES